MQFHRPWPVFGLKMGEHEVWHTFAFSWHPSCPNFVLFSPTLYSSSPFDVAWFILLLKLSFFLFYFCLQMHSGSPLTPNNPAFSVSIGIAALVIEGRPLFDDEFTSTTVSSNTTDQLRQHDPDMCFGPSSSSAFSRSVASHRYRRQFIDSPPSPNSSASPNVAEHHAMAYGQSSNTIQSTPSTFMNKQDTAQHLQRLRHKLIQLRSTPSTSRDIGVDQSVVVSVESSPTNAHAYDSDEELEMIYKQQKLAADATQSVTMNLVKPTALNSLQLLAANTLHTTPRSYNEHIGLLQTIESWTGDRFKSKFATPTATATAPTTTTPLSSSSSSSSESSSMSLTAPTPPMLTNIQIAKLKAKAKMNAKLKDQKILGPHCELFLKKIGLMKPGHALADYSIDSDSHYCARSNETVRLTHFCGNFDSIFTSFLNLFAVFSLATPLPSIGQDFCHSWTDLHRSLFGTGKSCHSLGTVGYSPVQRNERCVNVIAGTMHCHPKSITFFTNHRLVWFTENMFAFR